MTDHPVSSDLSSLEDEALGWIAQLSRAEAGPGDVAALDVWLGKSQAHALAFEKALSFARLFEAAMGEIAGEAKNQASPRTDFLAHVRQHKVPRHFSRRALISGGVGLGIAASTAMMVTSPVALWTSLEALTSDYRTAKGEDRRVAIAQGIRVRLNTASALDAPADAGGFRLRLIEGEAEVRADLPAAKRLTMQAAGGEINAAKGLFNIRLKDGAAAVTCLDGVIEVRHGAELHSISANEQVVYSPVRAETPQRVDPLQAAGWRLGLIVARGRPVSEVVEEINRYRSGRVVIANEALARLRIDAVFHTDRLEDALSYLVRMTGAHWDRLPGGLAILR